AAENRYVEIWNLVFQQFFRMDDGSLRPLDTKNIDTGAGLERLLCAMVDSPSVYDTDELRRLVEVGESITGKKLGDDPESDVALKLLADHARTMTFLVADGVVPSNEERGFVLRRIIRRAIRFAYLLGVETPVTPLLAQRTIEMMAGAYPVLGDNADTIVGVLGREEEQFRRTLRSGLTILDNALEALPAGGELPGEVAFQLHDTYGFPLDVTSEIVDDRGFSLDRPGFDAAMAEQRRRAREAGKKGGVSAGEEADAVQAVLDASGTTEFVGREVDTATARVVGVIRSEDGALGVFLDRSPFYAESGGQIGDTGTITAPDGSFVGNVVDTVLALPGLHRHVVEVVSGSIEPGDAVEAAIDVDRRNSIRRNHTGTHLLHWALREVLGTHVKQQGSWVGPDRLRFDFSHFEAVSPEQIAAIEDLVNREVLANEVVDHFETTKDEATSLGAIAFFGEKYGDRVHVLQAGSRSIELCGGTHVSRTGDIGPMKIVTETSIGSNLRRVEAITGLGPVDRIRREEAELAAAAERVGVPQAELLDGIDKRMTELRDLRAEVKQLRSKLATGGAGDLAGTAVDGVVVARVDGLDRDDLRSLAVAVRDRPDIRGVVLIGAPEGGGVALVAATEPGGSLHASELIAGAAKAVGGGGGKNPELAVAGGRNPDQIDQALDLARSAAGLV
ncbi:MAG: alanine--tRNA ligase, partial [Acidimicrobiales bacterium]|nr:alanine--tRNA ligase [Acidimicrobiales bacterium]